MEKTQQRKRATIVIFTLIFLALLTSFYLFNLKPVSFEEAPLTGSPLVFGAPDAPLKVSTVINLACSYCAEHELKVMPALQEAIDADKLRYAVWVISRDERLTGLSNGVYCAAKQGLYRPYVEGAFLAVHEIRQIPTPDTLAETVGAELEPFKACMAERKANKPLAANNELIKELGIRGTPAFFVNRPEESSWWAYFGTQPLAWWQDLVKKVGS